MEETFSNLITNAKDLVFLDLTPAELKAVDRETKNIIQSMEQLIARTTGQPSITATNLQLQYEVKKTPQRMQNRITHIMHKVIRAFEQSGYHIRYVKGKLDSDVWVTFYWKIANPPDDSEDKNHKIQEFLKKRRITNDNGGKPPKVV